MEQALRIENEMAGVNRDVGGKGTPLKGEIRIGMSGRVRKFRRPSSLS